MNFPKEFSDKLNASANSASPYHIDYRNLLLVYFALVSKSQLCKLEAEYLEDILGLAQSDDKLAILLNQIDNITYENLSYFNPEAAIYHDNGNEHDEREITLELIIKQQSRPSLIDYQTLLTDYYTLAMRYEQSEVEIEYLGRILELAQTDDRLALLLNEIDQITYQELGLVEKSREAAQTQQAREQIKRIIAAQAATISQDNIPQDHMAQDHMAQDHMAQDHMAQDSSWHNRQHLSTGYIARISRLVVTSHISWLVVGGVAASLLALLRGAALLGIHWFPTVPLVAISPTITPEAKAAELPKKQPTVQPAIQPTIQSTGAATHPIQQEQPVIEVSTTSQQRSSWKQTASNRWSEPIQTVESVAAWHRSAINLPGNASRNTSKNISRDFLSNVPEKQAKLTSLSDNSNQINTAQTAQSANIEHGLRQRSAQSPLQPNHTPLEIVPASTSALSLFDQQPFLIPAAPASPSGIVSFYCDPLLLYAGQPQEQSVASVQWSTEADLLLGTGAIPCNNRSKISSENVE